MKRTFIPNQTHLHIFQLLPQRISEVTNFQHLQMRSRMIEVMFEHFKLHALQAPVVLSQTVDPTCQRCQQVNCTPSKSLNCEFSPSTESVQIHRPSSSGNVPPARLKRSPSNAPAACKSFMSRNNGNPPLQAQLNQGWQIVMTFRALLCNLSSTAWWLSWQRATVSRMRSGSTPTAPSAWSSRC